MSTKRPVKVFVEVRLNGTHVCYFNSRSDKYTQSKLPKVIKNNFPREARDCIGENVLFSRNEQGRIVGIGVFTTENVWHKSRLDHSVPDKFSKRKRKKEKKSEKYKHQSSHTRLYCPLATESK